MRVASLFRRFRSRMGMSDLVNGLSLSLFTTNNPGVTEGACWYAQHSGNLADLAKESTQRLEALGGGMLPDLGRERHATPLDLKTWGAPARALT